MNIYVFSDIHGRYSLWKQIQATLGQEDIGYCLGDCIDRGDKGIKILQELKADSRFVLLLGNHEQMLLDYIDIGLSKLSPQHWENIEYNGTKKTLQDFFSLSKKEQKDLYNWLKQSTFLYKVIKIENKQFFLSHAGGNPDKLIHISDPEEFKTQIL